MRAIVTGCAGFIGSHLTERLLADGHEVVGIDAFTSYYERSAKDENLAPMAGARRFALVEADVATADLDRLMSGADAVFHLAAQPGVRASFGDGFHDYVHDNIVATQRVLEAAIAVDCGRVVMASSSSVYGDAETYPCIEHVTPMQPRSPYGVSKRTCEDLANVYRSERLQVVALRFFTVYGPRQRPDMAFRRLCEAACGGPVFELYGDGSQSRDFTHVDDVVDAVMRCAFVERAPTIVNVGGGHEASMAEVITELEDLVGERIPMERFDVQRGDVRRTAADTTVARTRLGWTPVVDLRTGLATELDWVRARVARRSLLSAGMA